MNIIIGKRSRLSSALLSLSNDNKNLISLQTATSISELEKLDPIYVSKIFCVGAITDPNADLASIENINVNLPVKIRTLFPKSQIVTFGTILEVTNLNNSYVNSKRKLQHVLAGHVGNSIHFRLHTLYGRGLPKEHMFLCQLFEALKNNKAFSMSSGQQFREYHHYDDVARIILDIVDCETTLNTINLTSGQPLQLLELAQYLKKKLNSKIDISCSKENNPNEIYQKILVNEKTNGFFRDSKLGIENYMKDLLNGKF